MSERVPDTGSYAESLRIDEANRCLRAEVERLRNLVSAYENESAALPEDVSVGEAIAALRDERDRAVGLLRVTRLGDGEIGQYLGGKIDDFLKEVGGE